MEQLLLFIALMTILYVGFALLSLSQSRHWRTIGVGPPLPRMATIIVRVLGFALLALALPITLWCDGADFGSLLWGVLLSIAACAVTLTLSWRPGWLYPLARAVYATTLLAGKGSAVSEKGQSGL
jgi:hypothetical protein